MSFTGDLEHLPIVDIVQLLHAARKSGALLVRGKTESQLVFDEGRVVSAIHGQSGPRLARILRESQLLNSDALAELQAGAARQPGLLAALLHQGLLNQEQALSLLEKLLQFNLVEMLSWQQGTFSLDVDSVPMDDEFRLLAEATGEPVRFDTQGLLMDALRIFDEKKRDSVLEEEFDPAGDETPAVANPDSTLPLSLEDLGLDALDQLERKIPDVFTSLRDPISTDPQLHLQQLAAGLAPQQMDELYEALQAFSASAGGHGTAGSGPTLVFYSADALVSHCLTTVCKGRGFPVFATTDAADLEPILAQSLGKGLLPLLVIDVSSTEQGEFSPQRLQQRRRQVHGTFPQIPIIEWHHPAELSSSLQAFRDGVRGVFPRPCRRADTFIPDLLLLLESFLVFVQGGAEAAAAEHLARLQSSMRELRQLSQVLEIADLLLRFVAAFCPRAIVLVAAPPGLVAGRSSGVAAGAGESAPLRLQIPLDEDDPLWQTLGEGKVLLASQGDRIWQDHLYPLIGRPASPAVLLVPLLCQGKKLALIYGDFGQQSLARLPLELLDVLATQAALQLEAALPRQKPGDDELY
jgi:hypothetical protein